jgi:hypothetical protein
MDHILVGLVRYFSNNTTWHPDTTGLQNGRRTMAQAKGATNLYIKSSEKAIRASS